MLAFFTSIGLFFYSLLPDRNYSTLTASQKKQLRYEQKCLKKEAKYKYKLSLMPKSGYMTISEYEAESYVKDKTKGAGEFIPKPDMTGWKYYPQPTYKIIRYNDPPGSHELNIDRKVKFNRSEILPGIVAPNFKYMIYPEISYFVTRNALGCDLYLLPLELTLTPTERVIKANIARKNSSPILSTTKNFQIEGEFRTLTPVDFSPDASKLIIKEKIGSNHDGIWRTDLWVYDFDTNKVDKLESLREAILFYWRENREVDLTDVRWDIYPLGFDAQNQTQIIVNAYAYTGRKPKFLGAWSVNYDDSQARLISLDNENLSVSIVGFTVIKDSIIPIEVLKKDAKKAKKLAKKAKKEVKKQRKLEKKQKKAVYKQELKDIKTLYKQKKKGFYRKQPLSTPTGIN